MSQNGNNGDGGSEITVHRDRSIFQKESLTVKSKRGTGTNDRDEVRKEVVREAELDIPDGMLDRFPSLIGDEQAASVVADVVGTMTDVRDSSNADDA